MLQETYARLSSIAERYADPIVATAFENWPQMYQDHALAHPGVSIPLSAQDIDAVLRGNADRSRWRREAVTLTKAVSETIDVPYARVFPKIGPVSWKEVPAFRTIESAEVGALLPALLSSVTSRMAIILEAFVIKQVPTFLHFFPALDLSSFIEVRVRIARGRVIDAKWQTIPQGIKPDVEMKETLMEAAALLCENSPLPNFMIDLCLDCSEAGARPKLVEINPDVLELKTA